MPNVISNALVENRLRTRFSDPMPKHRDVTAEDRVQELFQPDTLLPSQYCDRVRRRSSAYGEHRLMVAILEDAVDVYRKQVGARDRKRRQLFEDAESWIESDDRSWIFSYENICDMLRIDADYLRSGLRAWKAKALGARTRIVAFPEDHSEDETIERARSASCN